MSMISRLRNCLRAGLFGTYKSMGRRTRKYNLCELNCEELSPASKCARCQDLSHLNSSNYISGKGVYKS
jgi:hypothetical protein